MNAVVPVSIKSLDLELTKTSRQQENLKKLLEVIAIVEVVASAVLRLMEPHVSMAVSKSANKYFFIALWIAFPTSFFLLACVLSCGLQINTIRIKLNIEYNKYYEELLIKAKELETQRLNLATHLKERLELIMNQVSAIDQIGGKLPLSLQDESPAENAEVTRNRKALEADIERLYIELNQLESSENRQDAPLHQKKMIEIKRQLAEKLNCFRSDKTKIKLALSEVISETKKLRIKLDQLKKEADPLAPPKNWPLTERIAIQQEIVEVEEILVAKYGVLGCLAKANLDREESENEAELQLLRQIAKELKIPTDDQRIPLPNLLTPTFEQ